MVQQSVSVKTTCLTRASVARATRAYPNIVKASGFVCYSLSAIILIVYSLLRHVRTRKCQQGYTRVGDSKQAVPEAISGNPFSLVTPLYPSCLFKYSCSLWYRCYCTTSVTAEQVTNTID